MRLVWVIHDMHVVQVCLPEVSCTFGTLEDPENLEDRHRSRHPTSVELSSDFHNSNSIRGNC